GRRAPDGAAPPRQCGARGPDPSASGEGNWRCARRRSGRPLCRAAVAPRGRRERHPPTVRLYHRRSVAHADLARLRAAWRGAESVRPARLHVRHLRREPYGAGLAGAALAHARTAAACTDKPEYGFLGVVRRYDATSYERLPDGIWQVC